MLREYSAHSVWVLEFFRRCVAGHVSSVWQYADTVQAHKMYCVVVLFSVQFRFYSDVRGCDALWCDVVLQYVGCIFGVSVWSFRNAHSIWKNNLDATFLVLFRLVRSTLSGMITQLGLLKSGKWHFDVWAIGATRCHVLGRDTRVSIKFLPREDPARWNSAIRCERGNISWQIGATRCHPSKRSKATAIYHWKRWNRIGINWQWNQDHS